MSAPWYNLPVLFPSLACQSSLSVSGRCGRTRREGRGWEARSPRKARPSRKRGASWNPQHNLPPSCQPLFTWPWFSVWRCHLKGWEAEYQTAMYQQAPTIFYDDSVPLLTHFIQSFCLFLFIKLEETEHLQVLHLEKLSFIQNKD